MKMCTDSNKRFGCDLSRVVMAKTAMVALIGVICLNVTPALYAAEISVNSTAANLSLSSKKTERVDGSSSTAVVSGGVSADGGLTTTELVYVPAEVSIQVSIAPEPQHVGKAADLIVVVGIGSAMLVLDDRGQLTPLDGSNVPTNRRIARLEESNHFVLFSGWLGQADVGEFNIIAGYLVEGATGIGDIVYNVEPIHLKTQAAPLPVPNLSPVVSIVGGSRTIADSNRTAGEVVAMTAAATDSDGVIVSTEWLVDGAVVASGLAANLSLKDGQSVVTFKATDNKGSSSSTSVTITTVAYVAPVLTLSKKSSLGSFFGSSEFSVVSIPSLCELPSCSRTVSATLVGSSVYDHSMYKLAAKGGDFRITSVTARDTNGVTTASVSGLQAGTIIEAGKEVQFTLRSGLTGGRQAILLWTIEVEGLGVVLKDTVQFRSN